MVPGHGTVTRQKVASGIQDVKIVFTVHTSQKTFLNRPLGFQSKLEQLCCVENSIDIETDTSS